MRWSVNLLVAPLQEVWTDGDLTKTPLRRIDRLLLQIRRTWAKAQAEVVARNAAEEAATIAEDWAAGFDAGLSSRSSSRHRPCPSKYK